MERDGNSEYAPALSLSELFEAQAARTPETVALRFEDTALTYRELNERANQLAHYLQRSGVGPDVLVGILMHRSVEMLVAVLGILKAGGAYVPLDPSYPGERLAFMAQDAGLDVADAGTLSEVPGGYMGANAEFDANSGMQLPARATRIWRAAPSRRIWPTSSIPRAQPDSRKASWSATRTSRACSRLPSLILRLMSATSGRSSIPTLSISRSGKSGARSPMAGGWWSSPTGQPLARSLPRLLCRNR